MLKRAGLFGAHVPHGWRSSFATIMAERNPADAPIIDLMLAHAPKDQVAAAYNRAQYLPKRREIAQAWADLLLEGMSSPLELVAGRQR